jgi:hypothetical protein
MRYALIAVTAVAAGIAGDASASQLKGTPYTFTGSVITATASCPYAAKAKLAGYTLINPSYIYSYTPTGGYKQTPIIAGPALVFSPGGTAGKLVMKIGNLPAHTGASAGKAEIVLLPSTAVVDATYTGSFTVNADSTYGLTYTVSYRNAGKNCTTKYELALKKGLPANLYNLL